jgi:hypothetical protein
VVAGDLMLLQTNSYFVPKEKRAEHARLLVRFKHALARIGCDHFEAYEQVPAHWAGGESMGRFVQIMRFRDRKHQQQVQAAERTDQGAQALIREFCDLIDLPRQQQQGTFAAGFYMSAVPLAADHVPEHAVAESPVPAPAEPPRTSPVRRPPPPPHPTPPVAGNGQAKNAKVSVDDLPIIDVENVDEMPAPVEPPVHQPQK